MEKAVSLFCLLATLISAVKVESLNCPNGERPYPPNSCINLSTATSLANAFTCGSSSSKLITFEDSEQFNTLSRYVELYQQNYWTGYRYNASGALVDSDDSLPSLGSPVLDSNNFAPDQPAPEADVTCLFIGVVDGSNDVRLFRQMCSMELRYICADPVQVPSITLATSVPRFLSQGSSIILTCTAMNNDGPIMWRRNGTEISSDTSGVVINDDTLTVISYDGVTANYECVAGSRVGGVVSQAVVLEISGAESPAPTIMELSSAPLTPVQLGTSVTLTCSFTSGNTLAMVEWFVSGEMVFSAPLATGDTQATFTVDSFSIVGVYQCRVLNENGDNAIESLFISGTAGTPGFVTSPIIALADSQSQIFISWLYPIDHNVLDPTLLRYEVFYQEGTLFDLSSASSNTGLLPVLLNGQISEVGDVQTTLTGLNPGTTYSVAIRAVSTASSGGLGGGTVIVSTFGNVPVITVDDSLKVQRTTDNKTLFADWSDVKTTPPVGQVARYCVEYRNSGKNDAKNSAILDPKFSYLVVSPVENAQNYQVRVRIGVIVERMPLTYDYGPFTKWVLVQGVTNTVPPVPPTQAIFPATGVIVAAVVVPTLILALMVFVIIFGAVCYCVKSGKKDNYSPRQKITSRPIDLRPEEQKDAKELEAMEHVI